jgi:hypothetical protein
MEDAINEILRAGRFAFLRCSRGCRSSEDCRIDGDGAEKWEAITDEANASAEEALAFARVREWIATQGPCDCTRSNGRMQCVSAGEKGSAQ